MHSLMIARHGKVAVEGWWQPYEPERTHMLHSVTKAFTSTAVGIAVGEGLVDLDALVSTYFPERIEKFGSGNLSRMRVRHLLSQTSGHDRGVSGSVWRSIPTSWVDEFLKIPVPHEPGERFQYSSATSFMLSAIISRVTGMPMANYLRDRLFKPAGMTSLLWDAGPEGINPGGNGASATTSDILKLGLLYLNDGMWDGRRLLPAGWAAQASAPTGSNPYGLHWWVLPGKPGYFAFGAFGQYIFVFPELDAVIATTAAVPGSISRPDVGLPPIIWQHLDSLFGVPGGAAVDDHLRARQSGLTVSLLPNQVDEPVDAASLVGTFAVDANVDGVSSVSLEIDQDHCILTLMVHGEFHVIEAGVAGRYNKGTTSMPGFGLHHGYEPELLHVVATSGWVAPNVFRVACQYVETAFRDNFDFELSSGKVTLIRRVNVNGAFTEKPKLMLVREMT